MRQIVKVQKEFHHSSYQNWQTILGLCPCAFIVFSSSIAFLLKSLYRRDLQAILRNSQEEQNKIFIWGCYYQCKACEQ